MERNRKITSKEKIAILGEGNVLVFFLKIRNSYRRETLW